MLRVNKFGQIIMYNYIIYIYIYIYMLMSHMSLCFNIDTKITTMERIIPREPNAIIITRNPMVAISPTSLQV